MLHKKGLLTLALLILPILLLVVATEILQIRLYERIATMLCVSLVLVLGLQIFMGNSGILSFAHIGFMGVGAYTSAVLSIPVQMKGMALPDLYPVLQGVALSPYISIVVGGLVAALVATLISYPLMRLSDAAAVITHGPPAGEPIVARFGPSLPAATTVITPALAAAISAMSSGATTSRIELPTE